MPAKCKPSTQILPATCAWILLLTCTAIFFGCASEYFASQYSPAIIVYEGLLSIFVVVNFGLATFMDPGSYPRAREDEVKAGTGDQRAPLYKSIDIDGIVIRMKWCATCQFYRPPRCSHCSVCDNCIEIFDHHCPWVNNCIGRTNYRFFFQFLVSLTCDMFSLFALCITFIIKHKDDLVTPNNILLIIVIVIIGITCVPVIGLTCFHIILISKGKTTNEQVTGKLKGDHNPFTRGCLQNFQYTLCGPLWPRLIDRERKSAALNPDSIRLIYQSSVNRLYLEKSTPALTNGIKTVTTQSSKLPAVGKDLSVTVDSAHIDHSTPLASPRVTMKAVPHSYQDLDDVPLGGSAHSMSELHSNSHLSLSGQPQLSALGALSGQPQLSTAGIGGHHSLSGQPKRSGPSIGQHSLSGQLQLSVSGPLSGQPQLSAPSIGMFSSVRHTSAGESSGRNVLLDHQAGSAKTWSLGAGGRSTSGGISTSMVSSTPRTASYKRKQMRNINGETTQQAPMALAEELTPSPTTAGFDMPPAGSTVNIVRGPAAIIHTTSSGPHVSVQDESLGQAMVLGRARTGERAGQTTGSNGVNSLKNNRQQGGRVKSLSRYAGAYSNFGEGSREASDDLNRGDVRTGVGIIPGSIKRPRSFAKALEADDKLPAPPRRGSREALESVGEEMEELDETHPSILEISV